jgi:putative nucleotidyltransferase with HDIG domain
MEKIIRKGTELEFFSRLSNLISTFKDVEEMCVEVVNLITDSLNFERSLIILKGWRGEFYIAAVSGVPKSSMIEMKHVRCTDAVIKFVDGILKNKNTVKADSLPPEICEFRGEVAVSPLFSRGEGMGALIAESVGLDDNCMYWVDTIARYISIGFENHNVFNELMSARLEMAHEIDTLQLMHEIGKEILSNLKTEEILETVALMIRRVIPCDGIMVTILDPERNVFKVISSWGTGIDKDTELQEGDIPFYGVLTRGKPFYQQDITSDFKGFPKLMEWSAEKNVFSYFCVPLMVKDKLFGVLILSSIRSAWFTTLHIAITEKVATQVGIALENAKLLEDIEEIFIGTVTSLVKAIDAKSEWTKGHSLRVADYALKLAKRVGFGGHDMERLRLAAILHDIGKIGTYEAILDKPGKLTQEEISLIRKHPSQGADILTPLNAMKDIIPMMKYHHERYDGSGYPDRLEGEDIPLSARILAIADVYDAMRSERPYRKGLDFDTAVEELRKGAGTQFDPILLDWFIDIINKEKM